MNTRTPLSMPVGPIAREPGMPEYLFAAVIEAFRWAWSLLRAETAVDPMTDEEERITFEIGRLLNQRVDGKRRATMLRLFETVQREAQHEGADESFRNKPDLTLRPKGLPRGVANQDDWGVFAECKIIEGKRHEPRTYCQKGLHKFVIGRYARCMSTGLMVAFVRDGRLPRPTLRRLLKNGGFATLTLQGQSQIRDMARSAHDRSRLVPPCVNIEISHLWLDARPYGSRGRSPPTP